MIKTFRVLSSILLLCVGPLWGAAQSFPYGEPEHLKRFIIFVLCYLSLHCLAVAIRRELSKEQIEARKLRTTAPIPFVMAFFNSAVRFTIIVGFSLLTLYCVHYLRKELELIHFGVLITAGVLILAAEWFPWRKGLAVRASLAALSAFCIATLSFSVLLRTLSWQAAVISLATAFLFTALEIGSLYAVNHRELVSRKASKRIRITRFLWITKAQALLLFLAPIITVFLCVSNELPGRYLLLLTPIPLIPKVHAHGVDLAQELSSSKNPALRAARRYYVETLAIVTIFFAIIALLGI